jgi:hypothetical protein
MRSKPLVVAVAVALATFTPSLASADDRRGWERDRYRGGYDHRSYSNRYDRHDRYGRYRHEDHRRGKDDDDHDDAIVAGVVGLALGALIAGALSQPDRSPQRTHNYAPPPPQGYGYGYEQGYQSPYQSPRTCTVVEPQWDPYAGRTLMIERSRPC